MENFAFGRAPDTAAAVEAARSADTVYLAGGTELLNWMRLGIAQPEHVLDIGRLEELQGIVADDADVHIGALATLNEIGEHPAVARDLPVLSQACLQAASPQLRNLATLGGNILQKTRCPYFRAEGTLPWPCNKREPGAGCAARKGENRQHAIFGWSEACVATQPSDPAVALAALDAVVHVLGPQSERAIPMTEFHRLPGSRPEEETVLLPGELIIGFEIDSGGRARQSHYLKVRERASYEYALVSAAVVIERDGDHISGARVALGGVAHKPWRLTVAEERLRGVPLEPAALRAAIQPAFAEARPLAQNGFKVELAQRAVVRALQIAGGEA
jgi:xanthine dehydrogenase YagS FAD-binding subunit